MKILNWIYKALNFIKNSAELIKWIVIAVLAVTTLTGLKFCKNQKQDKDNLTTVLTSKIETYKTELGKNVTQAESWKIKYKSLEQVASESNNENNAKINEISKELLEARQTIKELGLKQKNVQNYIKNELVSKDSLRTKIVYLEGKDFEIKPIRKKHIEIDFIKKGLNLDIIYSHKTDIHTILDRKAEPKKRAILKKNIGKKHLLLPECGFIWGWDYYTTSIVEDTCSTITNIVSIEFDK